MDQLKAVLQFANGWMSDEVEAASEGDEASRREQLKRLRQLCIPEIASLLHTVLNSTKNYKECVKLADLIASENHRLYQVRTQLQLSVNTMYSYCQLYIIHAAYCTSENISW